MKLKIENRRKWNTFYLNYIDFNENRSSWCEKKNLKMLNVVKNQQMIPCFGREPIVAQNQLLKEHPFYNRLNIYPEDEKSMMIFELIPNTNPPTYTFMSFPKEIPWSQLTLVPSELFLLFPPISMDFQDPEVRQFSLPFLRNLPNMYVYLNCQLCLEVDEFSILKALEYVVT